MSGMAFNTDFSGMQLGQVAHQRKPQAGAPGVAIQAAVELNKGLKDLLLIFTGDTNPGIFDFDDHLLGGFTQTGAQTNLATGPGKLDRVAEQIDQNLFDANAVGMNPERFRKRFVAQGLALDQGHLAHEAQAVFTDIIKQQGLWPQRKVPSPDFGQVEDIIDQRQKVLTAVVNGI